MCEIARGSGRVVWHACAQGGGGAGGAGHAITVMPLGSRAAMTRRRDMARGGVPGARRGRQRHNRAPHPCPRRAERAEPDGRRAALRTVRSVFGACGVRRPRIARALRRDFAYIRNSIFRRFVPFDNGFELCL